MDYINQTNIISPDECLIFFSSISYLGNVQDPEILEDNSEQHILLL